MQKTVEQPVTLERVREIGAIFVMFIPMGYVDATASIGIASKWKRIIVACASNRTTRRD